MTYMSHTRRPPREHQWQRRWLVDGWRGLAIPLGLRPGDVLILTRPPVWSRDGTSRMRMAVEQPEHTRQVAAVAATQSNEDPTSSDEAVRLRPPAPSGCPDRKRAASRAACPDKVPVAKRIKALGLPSSRRQGSSGSESAGQSLKIKQEQPEGSPAGLAAAPVCRPQQPACRERSPLEEPQAGDELAPDEFEVEKLLGKRRNNGVVEVCCS